MAYNAPGDVKMRVLMEQAWARVWDPELLTALLGMLVTLGQGHPFYKKIDILSSQFTDERLPRSRDTQLFGSCFQDTEGDTKDWKPFLVYVIVNTVLGTKCHLCEECSATISHEESGLGLLTFQGRALCSWSKQRQKEVGCWDKVIMEQGGVQRLNEWLKLSGLQLSLVTEP